MLSAARSRFCSRTRSRRAVGLMFFVLVALPILMFAMAWGIDATRVFVAQRQGARAAEAAAVAGAFQFKGDTFELDAPAARRVARETIDEWQDFGAMRAISDMEVVDVDVTPFTGNPQTVTVRLRYRIGGMMFAGFFAAESGVEANVERSATVCVPGDVFGRTGGFCKRPDTP